MKEGIHPKVYNAKLVCACGNVVEVLSTKGEVVNVEICSACHPAVLLMVQLKCAKTPIG